MSKNRINSLFPMPGYDWSCHVCQRANSSQTAACSRCGFDAFASGRQIKMARARERPEENDQPIVCGSHARTDNRRSQTSHAGQAVIFVIALSAILGLMYYSVVYLYPDGRPLKLTGFVLFWFREIMIIAFAAFCLLICAAGWGIRLIRRISGLRK